MANGNDERNNPKRKVGKEDFLSEHGMTPTQQFIAERHAAAVPASDFEGYYPMPGYDSPGAQRLQRILFASRMRKAMEIPKVNDDETD